MRDLATVRLQNSVLHSHAHFPAGSGHRHCSCGWRRNARPRNWCGQHSIYGLGTQPLDRVEGGGDAGDRVGFLPTPWTLVEKTSRSHSRATLEMGVCHRFLYLAVLVRAASRHIVLERKIRFGVGWIQRQDVWDLCRLGSVSPSYFHSSALTLAANRLGHWLRQHSVIIVLALRIPGLRRILRLALRQRHHKNEREQTPK